MSKHDYARMCKPCHCTGKHRCDRKYTVKLRRRAARREVRRRLRARLFV